MAKISIPKIPSSEITPEYLYMNRRKFMKLAAGAGVTVALAACSVPTPAGDSSQGDALPTDQQGLQDELGDPANSYYDITNYNNYYEFTESKDGPAALSKNFPTSPWQVEVSGLVNNPKTYSIDDLRKFPSEERVYRLRCVEAWSLVIPWNGFPLNLLIKEVEPMTSAKFVKFTSVYDPKDMPGQSSPFYPFPYIEGLRMDEAMNDLTFMVTGLYGKDLPNQDGAPLRVAIPWKYGFKSGKALVKIEFVEAMPQTFWPTIASNEYGFYANVNPNVPHPRWSQATERRIGETRRIDTLMFNGYSDQVAQMYSGMDLKANF
jgi:sulfoxide reductase catalytic subunit YedY